MAYVSNNIVILEDDEKQVHNLCLTVQHMSSKTADVYNQYHEAEYCGWEMKNFPYYFASRNYSFIFKHIPYNILILLIFEVFKVHINLHHTHVIVCHFFFS